MQNENMAGQCADARSQNGENRQGGGSVMGLAGAAEGNPKRMIGFGFSEALDRVKNGQRMARFGWNGRGQFIFIELGSDPSNPDERAGLLSGIKARLFMYGDQGTSRRLPHVSLRNTRGESVPWAPSQTDMLAEDWIPV